MRRLLIAGAAGVALTMAALPAHAYPTRDYEGGCGFDTLNDTLTGGTLGGPDRFTGVMYGVVAGTDSYGIPLPTSFVSVDCEIYINGVLTAVPVSASGFGVAAGAATFSFEAGPTDTVWLCEHVVVDGEDFGCGHSWDEQIPPKRVQNLLRLLNDGVFESEVDPLLCPVLGGLAPGVPGLLDITPQGDAAIAGSLVWDCPPYGT